MEPLGQLSGQLAAASSWLNRGWLESRSECGLELVKGVTTARPQIRKFILEVPSMIRKLSLWCFFTLVLCVSTVFAQKHTLPRLALKTWRPAPKATTNSAINAAKPGKFGLPLFNYAVDSSRDHTPYAGAIVGKTPFGNGGGTVKVPTQIVPVVIVTEVVATDLSADQFFSTGPGRTRSDPTKADHACLTAPNNIPTRLVEQSPILTKTDFSFGGTNVGKTQYQDPIH